MKFNLLRIISKIFYLLIILLLIITASGILFAYFDVPGGIKLYTVQSGSMEPAIRAGSLVSIRPVDTYQTGDIITFKAEKDRDVPNPRYTTTHRIINIEKEDDAVFYQTQGDANEAPDIELVAQDLVLGRMIFSLPYLGYPVSFAKTQEGLILLVIIPATIIIYSELVNVKNEVKKMITARRKEKLLLSKSPEKEKSTKRTQKK